jgi:hypothetical protein
MSPQLPDRPVLTVKEAAAILGVNVKTLYAEIDAGIASRRCASGAGDPNPDQRASVLPSARPRRAAWRNPCRQDAIVKDDGDTEK